MTSLVAFLKAGRSMVDQRVHHFPLGVLLFCFRLEHSTTLCEVWRVLTFVCEVQRLTGTAVVASSAVAGLGICLNLAHRHIFFYVSGVHPPRPPLCPLCTACAVGVYDGARGGWATLFDSPVRCDVTRYAVVLPLQCGCV